VVLLDPLGLIFTDCDVLPFHGVYYACYVYKCIGMVGLWASNKKVQKNEDGAVSPPYSLPLVAP
jgi:hypothetical protein